MARDVPRSHGKATKRGPKPIGMFPTFDEIAWRAHEIFTSDTGPDLTIFECWRRAEDELLDKAATRALRADHRDS
jgi:hypothetical protein